MIVSHRVEDLFGVPLDVSAGVPVLRSLRSVGRGAESGTGCLSAQSAGLL